VYDLRSLAKSDLAAFVFVKLRVLLSLKMAVKGKLSFMSWTTMHQFEKLWEV